MLADASVQCGTTGVRRVNYDWSEGHATFFLIYNPYLYHN